MEEMVGGCCYDYNERVGKSFEDISYDEKFSGFDGIRMNVGVGEYDVMKIGVVGYGVIRIGDVFVYDVMNVDYVY